MLTVGACLRFIPSRMWRQLANIAKANDLNLMEDYRKSQVLDHLNWLWDRSFSHEARLQYTPEQQQQERKEIEQFKLRIADNLDQWEPDVLAHLGAVTKQDKQDLIQALMTERPLSCALEKSREGFLISGLYAMHHALPQSTQAHAIGFRLDLYEDFCDGACFDKSDDMLFEQFKGNICLTTIKKHVGVTGIRSCKYAMHASLHKLWFGLITRKIAAGVGKAVRNLNKENDTDRFNAQILLWPGEEDAPWLDELPHIKQTVLTLRQHILHSALGNTFENAQHVLDRMLLPLLKQAQDVRMLYDYDYCDESLDYTTSDTQEKVEDNALADLNSLDYAPRVLNKKTQFITESVTWMTAFTQYLTDHSFQHVLDDPEALRAVKIMFHSNQGRIKKLFKTPDSEESTLLIKALIDKAVEEKAQATCRLIAIRMHHQLVQLQIREYRDLVKTLAYQL